MPARHPRRATARRTATAGATAVAALIGAAALTPGVAAASDSPEAAYLSAINDERQAHGLPRLVARHALNVVADAWAAHMAATGTLAHNPQLAGSVSNWQSLGENVGVGPDIHALDVAFWNSPEHRANILDPSYKDVGVGAVQSQGTIWITIDFRDPMNPEPLPTSAHRSGTSTHRGSATPQRHVQRHQRRHAHQARHQHRTLRYGSTGHDVARVQRRLGVAADGIFGPITQAAVRRFQRHHDHRATGVVGPRTWRALGV